MYFDELAVGQVFDGAPALTLTAGHAAVHQAIIGDRLRLPLDAGLCEAVTGEGPLAHPALVWDVAIGQSTQITQHAKANLFYRGLAFRRYPVIGDTLRTSTRVVALKQNRSGPTGLVAMRITTVDQRERPVLDFWRCAMLPLRDPKAVTGHADDLDAVGEPVTLEPPAWRLDAFRERARVTEVRPGMTWEIDGGDVVSSAPELARLTLNIARVHHDADERLVYGGHTIGLALSQATRALPDLVTVVGWQSCEHLGPVREGDVLHSTLTAEDVTPLSGGGDLVRLRSRVRSAGGQVLDWRYTALMA